MAITFPFQFPVHFQEKNAKYIIVYAPLYLNNNK